MRLGYSFFKAVVLNPGLVNGRKGMPQGTVTGAMVDLSFIMHLPCIYLLYD